MMTLTNEPMYKIKVSPYMTQKTTPGGSFDFMQKWNDNHPMPSTHMVVQILKSTPGMYRVSGYMSDPPYTQWTGWVIKKAILKEEELSLLEKQVFQAKLDSGDAFGVTIDIYETNSKKYGMTVSYTHKNDSLEEKLKSQFYAKRIAENSFKIDIEYYEDIAELVSDYNVLINNPNNYSRKKAYSYDVPKNQEEYPLIAFKSKPYEHQLEAYKYGMSMQKYLIADDQGLGKTMEAINIAIGKRIQFGYKHCLVICCVNSLKLNWVEEIKTHSNESAHVLGQKIVTRGINKGSIRVGGNKEKIADLKNLHDIDDYFIITNVESLLSDEITKLLHKAYDDGLIEMIIVDEFHKAKNTECKQGENLNSLLAECKIALSGTPMLNTPMDLYAIFSWLEYEKHTFAQFKRFYSWKSDDGYGTSGYRNMDILQHNLQQIMLRRKKEQVLTLPEKVYIEEYLEMSPQQEKLYNDIRDGLIEKLDDIIISPNPLAKMIRLRQATADMQILTNISEGAKVAHLANRVQELTNEGTKVIVFSNWTEVTDIAETVLKDFDPIVITGKVPDDERVKLVKEFQTNPERMVVIGTLGAAGTGLTMTAANAVIFLDEPWTNGEKEQAVDRAHRIGTTKTVFVYTYICKNTIDERVRRIVSSKKDISDFLVDNQPAKSRLVRFLLGLDDLDLDKE